MLRKHFSIHSVVISLCRYLSRMMDFQLSFSHFSKGATEKKPSQKMNNRWNSRNPSDTFELNSIKHRRSHESNLQWLFLPYTSIENSARIYGLQNGIIRQQLPGGIAEGKKFIYFSFESLLASVNINIGNNNCVLLLPVLRWEFMFEPTRISHLGR